MPQETCSLWKTSRTSEAIFKGTSGTASGDLTNRGKTPENLILNNTENSKSSHNQWCDPDMVVECCCETGKDRRGLVHCDHGCRMPIQVSLHQQWWDTDMAVQRCCKTSMYWSGPIHCDNRSSMSTQVQWWTQWCTSAVHLMTHIHYHESRSLSSATMSHVVFLFHKSSKCQHK